MDINALQFGAKQMFKVQIKIGYDWHTEAMFNSIDEAEKYSERELYFFTVRIIKA